jgi:hypothetical protein
MWNRLILKFVLNIITTYFLIYINVSLQVLLLYTNVHKIYVINILDMLLTYYYKNRGKDFYYSHEYLFEINCFKQLIAVSLFCGYIVDIFFDLFRKTHTRFIKIKNFQ